MNETNKFVVIPKETVTITVSLKSENNSKLQRLSTQSKRSKNELVNLALRFAFEQYTYIRNKNNKSFWLYFYNGGMTMKDMIEKSDFIIEQKDMKILLNGLGKVDSERFSVSKVF